MKMKCVLAFVISILLFIQTVGAQQIYFSFIPSERLTITYNKTTNLIFPCTIQSIDRGSKDILVQQPKGTENIVQVKADKINFKQTNLSVITTNGKLYSFTVDYTNQPDQLNFIIQNKSAQSTDSNFKQTVQLFSANNGELYHAVAAKIVSLKARHVERYNSNQLEFKLGGIYVNHDILYFRLQLKNTSNISYDIDNIKFIIKERQRWKRTAVQETEITPVYKYGNLESVQADSAASGIIALPKFTLPGSKYLFIQVLEKNGGRNLHLFINNRKLMKATSIKQFN